MNRKLFLITIVLSSIINSFGQSKTVKILLDSNKIYLRFFYKHYKSDYTLNDSVAYLCRKINRDSFYLDKFVYKKKEWTKIYKIEPAKDSLRITTRAVDIKGNKKLIYSKEKYYNSIEIFETKN
ncbi:MAG: hypothetical protein ABIN97_05150 [Ginsengibacter sp.]